jgi:hypothetical protein
MPVFKYQGRENFKVVPDGEYIAHIADYEWKISKGQKTSGSDMLVIEANILDPKTLQPTGAKVFDNLLFAENTDWRIDVFLKAIGAEPEMNANIDINEEFCEQHVRGASAWVSVTHEIYNSVDRNKIAAWITNKGPAPTLAKKEEKGFE